MEMSPLATAPAAVSGESVQGRSKILTKLKADLKRNIIQDGHFS